MIWLCYAIMLIVPYLIGGVNTSIIVTKIATGKDIRTMGSGNAGLTNTLRSVGKKAALIVLIGDMSKSAVSVLLVRLSFWLIMGINTTDPASCMTWAEHLPIFMTMLGHCYPVYYGFKGGKGVLSALSGILVYDWRLGLILLVSSTIIIATTRYVSLASITGSVIYFITVFLFEYFVDHDPSFLINTFIGAFCGGLIIFRHHDNIKRLLTHTEKKLGEKSK